MKRGWRIAGWIGVPLIVVLGAAAGVLAYGFEHFNPNPPKIDYPKPKSALEAQRQDIDYFRKLIGMDRSYAPAARAQADRRLDILAAQRTLLDKGQLRVAFARVAALADNGHTSVYSNEHPNGRSFLLPIRVTAFSDGIYVMRTEEKDSDLLGSRVIAIDGKPIQQVIATLKTLRGGTDAWRRSYALAVLNAMDFLHGTEISPARDHSTWTFQTISGKTVQRTFVAYQPPYKEPQPDAWRWMSPQPVKDEKRHWAIFKPSIAKLPITLQDPDRTYRRVRLPGTCVILIQMKANEGDNISGFLKDTEADLRANKPCEIIFDNRYNGGGDYTNTARFAGRLHDLVRPSGHIYLLTGPGTFSAGITTTVFIKQAAAPGQVVILGEPVGDRMRFFSEGNSGCLPHAPFCVHYATGMHDYTRAPCHDIDKCFWLNWIYPAHTDSLQPNEIITMRFADYLAGHDPVFDRAVAMAKAHAARTSAS